MFKRKRAINPQQEFIAHSANELVPNIGERVNWVSPLLGKFTLLNVVLPKSKNISPPYYELRAGLRILPELQRFPLELYMFHGSGTILGIVRNLAHEKFSDESAKEFSENTDFQINNGLTAPNQEDYDNLELYLKNGKMDKA